MVTAIATNPMITTARDDVFAAVETLGVVPVWKYVPGDVAHVPAAVVYRPTLEPGAVPTTFDVDVTICVIGRRYDSDDVHAELDQLADQISLEFINHRLYTFNSTTPVVVSVAGTDFPAYEIDVTATAVAPC